MLTTLPLLSISLLLLNVLSLFLIGSHLKEGNSFGSLIRETTSNSFCKCVKTHSNLIRNSWVFCEVPWLSLSLSLSLSPYLFLSHLICFFLTLSVSFSLSIPIKVWQVKPFSFTLKGFRIFLTSQTNSMTHQKIEIYFMTSYIHCKIAN